MLLSNLKLIVSHFDISINFLQKCKWILSWKYDEASGSGGWVPAQDQRACIGIDHNVHSNELFAEKPTPNRKRVHFECKNFFISLTCLSIFGNVVRFVSTNSVSLRKLKSQHFLSVFFCAHTSFRRLSTCVSRGEIILCVLHEFRFH